MQICMIIDSIVSHNFATSSNNNSSAAGAANDAKAASTFKTASVAKAASPTVDRLLLVLSKFLVLP